MKDFINRIILSFYDYDNSVNKQFINPSIGQIEKSTYSIKVKFKIGFFFKLINPKINLPVNPIEGGDFTDISGISIGHANLYVENGFIQYLEIITYEKPFPEDEFDFNKFQIIK